MRCAARWFAALVLVCSITTALIAANRRGEVHIVAAFTLPKLSLAEFQNRVLPGSLAHDRGIALGSIGSDLWRGASDPKAEFWMVTDRGPNGQLKIGGDKRRTFPLPDFAPMIVRTRAVSGARGKELAVVEALPLTGTSGRSISGLPNHADRDEPGFDATGQTSAPINPSGVDTECLVRTSQGEFWLAEEYRPSLLRVDRKGRVLKRYIPGGQNLAGADYPVMDVLPEVYGRRQYNRGFEGLALSADASTLYLALQSPLAAPDKRTAKSSRNTRILAFDIAKERPIAEYVYRFDTADAFEPGAVPDDMKLGAVAMLGPQKLLVLERTDRSAKIYRVELKTATDILPTKWHDRRDGSTLEELSDPAAEDIHVLTKTLIVDLTRISGVPGKLEGLAVLNRTTIGVTNDNDFDLGNLDAAGNNVGHGTPSQLVGIRLDKPLY